MRRVPAVFMLCLVLSGPLYAADAETGKILQGLEQKMQKIETLQTRFLQTKQLSIFQKEVQLQGTLAMQKPDHFAWRTESPLRYSIVIEGNKMSQWDEDTGHVETLSFSSSPVMRMVVEQMQTWFYGAYGSLMGQYGITVLSKEPLTLQFIPGAKSPAFGMIRSITVYFKTDHSYIESMEIEEKNGDRSSMVFSETVLNGKISPSVWNASHAA